jgi:hypothetical protein
MTCATLHGYVNNYKNTLGYWPDYATCQYFLMHSAGMTKEQSDKVLNDYLSGAIRVRHKYAKMNYNNGNISSGVL